MTRDMENKQYILDALCNTLKRTYRCSDIISLTYGSMGNEYNGLVIAKFEHGAKDKSIIVDADGDGLQLIYDVIYSLRK